MDIVEDLEGLPADSPRTASLCVLARPSDGPLQERATDTLRLPRPPSGPGRRPTAEVDDARLSLVVFSIQADGVQLPLRLQVAGRGLLVVADDAALAVVRPAIRTSDEDPWTAMVASLVALARRSLDTMDDLADEAEKMQTAATGFLSAKERRTITRLRARLFALQQLFAEHRRILAPDEELARELPAPAHRLRRQAQSVFADGEATAARLYALLGDVLTEQTAAISERLTVVATVFLPLTLATGFFGMNFGWLTDHIGTASSFVLLGIVVPLLFTAGTMAAIRYLSRPG